MKAENPGRAFSLVLADELARCGVRHAVVSPGSRSAPLAYALHEHPMISVSVVLDERAAGFVGLGIAKATGIPAAVVTTSGSATSNLHPAVIESSYGHVPLVVITADRPPELRDTGAGQTIDQIKLFGGSVRWFSEVGLPADEPSSNAYWRSVACRAVAAAGGSSPGPVHLNVALRDPLVPMGPGFSSELAGRPGSEPWIASVEGNRVLDETNDLAALISQSSRGLLVVGQGKVDPSSIATLSETLSWPIIAEAISGARIPGTISTYDALLRVPSFADTHRPDVVVRIGRVGVSKALSSFLDGSVRQITVDPSDNWLDPDRTASWRVQVDPTRFCEELSKAMTPRPGNDWLAGWLDAEAKARRAIDTEIDGSSEMTEPLVARELAERVPPGAHLLVASSMPVRDLDWFMRPRGDITIHSNRGANGIDGFASTLVGLSVGAGQRAFGLCGDLALLHDMSGLIAARSTNSKVTLVVVNNDGGGIFSFLPQARWPESFEELFGTPHGIEPEAIAQMAGFGYQRWSDPRTPLVLSSEDLELVEVRTDRGRNVETHRRIWESVEQALR